MCAVRSAPQPDSDQATSMDRSSHVQLPTPSRKGRCELDRTRVPSLSSSPVALGWERAAPRRGSVHVSALLRKFGVSGRGDLRTVVQSSDGLTLPPADGTDLGSDRLG